jgi:retron-type reverse transcriptase
VQADKGTVHVNENKLIAGIGDQTAYNMKTKTITRRRSHHSRAKCSKGDSQLTPVSTGKISKSNPLNSECTLSRVTRELLDKYKEKNNNKYNGLIKLIADPDFLKSCYNVIKSNPGKNSKISTTLDGINQTWFSQTSKDLLEGRFKFTPARQVMIPKPNSDKLRPVCIGSTREKIVQKAIQVVLSTIYEAEFRDCSHGYRPSRSTHSALEPIHRHGSTYS